MTQRIVLAYSGGLDTSVCIPWLHQQTDAEIIALTVDVGEGRDLAAVQARAIAAGASECRVIDARERFAREFVLPALRANAAYEGRYYLSASLSRPLIAQLLVETARQVGAGAVAHGCTGKGNDQVRFDVSVGALAPDLKVLAPVREWGWTREEELAYAASCGLHLPVSGENPFSVDVNLWGRSCECGVLEDPWAAPPEAAYAWTRPLGDTPDEPEEIVIHFESGAPVAVDEQRFSLADLIEHLNARAGRHGVGRIDLIENRLVGIKSREVYEQPAAVVLTAAHRELEALTLPRELHHLKLSLEHTYARLIYDGLWFSPARQALEAFMLESQRTVTGEVRVRLFRGHATVVGRRSPWSLYRHDLATYAAGDAFNHRAAEGFIELFGLPTRVWAASQAGGGQTGAGVAEETPAPVEVAAR